MKKSNTQWLQALVIIVGSIYFLNGLNSKSKIPKWYFKKGLSYLYEYKSEGIIEGENLDKALKVSMKAELVQYITEKSKTGWTEELYFKNIHFMSDPFSLKNWIRDLETGVLVKKDSEGKVLSWKSISGKENNPFWKRLIRQTSIILPKENKANWIRKDFNSDSFASNYSVDEQNKHEVDLSKNYEYYKGSDHFSSTSEINIKSPYSRINFLSVTDMSEKRVANSLIISNTRSTFTFMSYDIVKLKKDVTKVHSYSKVSSPKKVLVNLKKEAKQLLSENMTTRDYVKFKKLLKTSPELNEELKELYLNTDPSSKVFRTMTKAFMSISSEQQVELMIEALNQNLENPEIASYLIASLSLSKSPSEKAIKTLEELTLTNEQLYNDASLGLGVMADKISVRNKSLGQDILNNRIKKIKAATEQKIINTELSSIGNMGFKEAKPFLEEKLSDPSVETQVNALKAMRRIQGEGITEIYLDILKNNSSDELKEQASYFLSQRKLENKDLLQIQKFMFQDISSQTKYNLIKSYLKQASEKDAKIIITKLLKTEKSKDLKNWLESKYH